MKADTQTLSGWKVIIGLVDIQQYLLSSKTIFPGQSAPDTAGNISEFCAKAKLKAFSAKAVSLRLRLGEH